MIQLLSSPRSLDEDAVNASLPHVLLVVDQFPRTLGGGERIVLKLAALLPQYGYRASILTFLVYLKNGEVLETPQIRRARGAAELPLGDAELFEKFRTCLDAGGARIAPELLFDRLRRLETLSAREVAAA